MSEPVILVLVGTKAQFIKTAPVLRALDQRGLGYRLVYTGQHSETFDMLERAFGTRPPDDVLVPSFEASTHGGFLSWTLRYWWAVAGRLLGGRWHGAKLALVHGDTASTLFGAIASRLAGVRVGHIEAGLRSPRLLEPFPEEIIRRLVSRLSVVHYAPDAAAAANLRGVRGRVVATEGNTLKDALAGSLRAIGELPDRGGEGGYAIASIHRSENLSRRAVFDMLMAEVLDAARRLPVKFVLHPATRERLRASDWPERFAAQPGLQLLERMDYPDFVRLLLGSRFLMTDGGSNQEEAAMLGLPTLLLRRATERNDGLGQNVVMSGLAPEAIRRFVAAHADASWPLGLVQGASPSAIIADDLVAELARA